MKYSLGNLVTHTDAALSARQAVVFAHDILCSWWVCSDIVSIVHRAVRDAALIVVPRLSSSFCKHDCRCAAFHASYDTCAGGFLLEQVEPLSSCSYRKPLAPVCIAGMKGSAPAKRAAKRQNEPWYDAECCIRKSMVNKAYSARPVSTYSEGCAMNGHEWTCGATRAGPGKAGPGSPY